MTQRHQPRRQAAAARRTGPLARLRATGLLVLLVPATAAAVIGMQWLTSGLLAAARRGGTTLDEAIGLAAVSGCWLCVGWFVLAVICSAAAAAPGVLGRTCSAAAEVLAPWTMRRIVAAGLGLTVVTGPAAMASGPDQLGQLAALTSVSSVSSVSPVFPVSSVSSVSFVDRTVPTDVSAELPPLDRPADAADVVTVRPGDCLWSIAARHLGPHATDADVAAAWPAWFAANRGVIGDDPNLIQPGQQLVAPG